MTSLRSTAALRILLRNVPRCSPSPLVKYRPIISPRPTSLTLSRYPQFRLYSTPSDPNVKIYSFAEISQVSQAPKDKIIIDVREPAELTAAGRIPHALNLPLSSLQDTLSLSPDVFREKFEAEKPGKEQEVIFYCKAGVRSANASNLAKEAGYQRIGNYTGSFDDCNGKISKA